MPIARGGHSQAGHDSDLSGTGRHQILPSDHLTDAHRQLIDGRRQVISDDSIGATKNDISYLSGEGLSNAQSPGR
jgi:hypothetical protein